MGGAAPEHGDPERGLPRGRRVLPREAPAQVPGPLIELQVDDDLRRRRLFVLLRPLLVVPHLGWLQLWGAIAVAAAVGNWLATLALGRAPEGLHVFLVGFLRYATHVGAYTLLLAEPFPGFGGRRGFAVELADVPRERQRRWTVLLRAPLALPPLLGAAVAAVVSLLFAIVAWVAALVLGRVPRALHAEFAWTLRFCVRVTAFALVLSDRYPRP